MLVVDETNKCTHFYYISKEFFFFINSIFIRSLTRCRKIKMIEKKCDYMIDTIIYIYYSLLFTT